MDAIQQWLEEHWAWVLLAIVAAFMLWTLLRASKPQGPPYVRRGPLVTRSELKFYRALKHAVKERWTIMAMVRIADLLAVRSGTPKHLAWFNRIACKHVDFVLCDPETLEPRLAIELDDESHQRPDRQERDEFVNAAFAAAGFPLARFPTANDYDVDSIRNQIQGKIGN